MGQHAQRESILRSFQEIKKKSSAWDRCVSTRKGKEKSPQRRFSAIIRPDRLDVLGTPPLLCMPLALACTGWRSQDLQPLEHSSIVLLCSHQQDRFRVLKFHEAGHLASAVHSLRPTWPSQSGWKSRGLYILCNPMSYVQPSMTG